MKDIRIVSINVDGNRLDRTFPIADLREDFFGECSMVPANDDEVILVEIDGEDKTKILKAGYREKIYFYDVVRYLRWME